MFGTKMSIVIRKIILKMHKRIMTRIKNTNVIEIAAKKYPLLENVSKR